MLSTAAAAGMMNAPLRAAARESLRTRRKDFVTAFNNR